jgi:hypothetical protein
MLSRREHRDTNSSCIQNRERGMRSESKRRFLLRPRRLGAFEFHWIEKVSKKVNTTRRKKKKKEKVEMRVSSTKA